MKDLADDVKAGQATYTRPFLSIYDIFVLWFSNNYIWKCSSANMLEMYDEHMSENHLDIGVGTGYFLAHSKKLKNCERLALVDLNKNSLKVTKNRLRSKTSVLIETISANILGDLPQISGQFDSVGINYLLHCLPGSIEAKLSRIISNVKPYVSTDSTIFGATILTGDVVHTVAAKNVLWFYNKKGIFSNYGDTLEQLTGVLEKTTKRYEIKRIGGVALFWASIS